MERSFKVCTFLLALFFISSLTPLQLAHAQAVFYKYVDKNGNVYFTDRLESIPEEYRNQIKVYKEEEKPKPAFSKEQGVTEEQNRRLREAEEKKREEEEKALQEKAAREEKLKERQEIQDRIASLEEQIRAKQEEQGSLWTSGMVYDRIRLNQLNAEISALVREIRSLQRELSDKEKE
jgi:DNA repair exonuclease SbcCD ATPase subunit